MYPNLTLIILSCEMVLGWAKFCLLKQGDQKIHLNPRAIKHQDALKGQMQTFCFLKNRGLGWIYAIFLIFFSFCKHHNFIFLVNTYPMLLQALPLILRMTPKVN